MHGSVRSTIRVLPLALAGAVAVGVAGCGEAADPATSITGSSDALLRAGPQPSGQFRTHLTGAEEVPAVSTRAQGQALFTLSADGTELSYKLIVANIENVLMAHIHLAPAGTNGGVVAWLYPDGPPPQLIEGRASGVLAEGVITASDLVGGLEGASLSALVEEMESGGAYVNVHTSQHPGGEVRGQIR